MHKPFRFRNPVFWAKMLQLVLLGVITIGMLGAGQSRYDRLGHNLMCSCGCGQILLECNHVGCPNSSGMIKELQQQISLGGADTAVMNWFAGKYGPTVLAAPIRGALIGRTLRRLRSERAAPSISQALVRSALRARSRCW